MKESQAVKILVSQILPNTPEGMALRKIIFDNETILCNDDKILDILQEQFPERKILPYKEK